MALIKEYDEELFKEKLKSYQKTYSDVIDKNYVFDLLLESEDGLIIDNVDSKIANFYAEYGLIIDQNKNRYKKFLMFLKELYSDLSTKNIIEVGGGPVPQLGREISKILVRDKTITVYDKVISMKNNDNYTNMIIKREEFNESTNISDADLVVGLGPCGCTEMLIKTACKNKKEFVVVPCGCEARKKYNGDILYYFRNLINNANEWSLDNGLGSVKMHEGPSSSLILSNKK